MCVCLEGQDESRPSNSALIDDDEETSHDMQPPLGMGMFFFYLFAVLVEGEKL